MKKILMGLFAFGQLLDFLTTFLAKERFQGRIRERNPLIAGLVQRRQWAKLFMIKCAVIGLTLFVSSGSRSPEKERETKTALVVSAFLTWLIVFSNIRTYMQASREK